MAAFDGAFGRAMKLAVVTGMRSALGPALLAAARDQPGRSELAMGAVAELVIDKIPYVPNRASMAGMIPRAVAGGWVASKSMELDGSSDPMAAPLGAAVAAGVGFFAPKVRRSIGVLLGVPDYVVALAEDYLALKLGSEAVGMSMAEVKQAGLDSVDAIKHRIVEPAVARIQAGSM